MKILNFRDFIKKFKLKDDTMNESQLQRVYNYPIHPDIRKCIQIKVLLILITDLKGGLIGLV